MIGALIGMIVFFLIILGIGIFVLKKYSGPTDEAGGGGGKNEQTAQEFLPFKQINKGMIDLGNGEYRMIVEVSSLNYRLMTSSEVVRMEQIFKDIISSWSFPFAFYIQTRELDKRDILMNTAEDIKNAKMKFPGLSEYADKYYQYLSDYGMTGSNNGNPLTKKKYIIIGSSNTNTLENSNEDEKEDYAFDELYNNASLVVSGLNSLGLNADVLNSYELVDLVYQAVCKSGGEIVDGITQGDFTAGFVSGGRELFDTHVYDKDIDMYVTEFINSLNVKVINNRNSTPEEITKANELIAKIKGYSPDNREEKQVLQKSPSVNYKSSANEPSYSESNLDDDVIIPL